MRQITGRAAAFEVLNDPSFVVPPVPPATAGVAWLRATVGRFCTGADHERRRALSVAILDAVPPAALRPDPRAHPVTVLARAIGVPHATEGGPGAFRVPHAVEDGVQGIGVPHPVEELVRAVAQAYQPGTGEESRADAAVERLVTILGGTHDEATAARIGVLVQACDATATLIERARHRPVEDVLRHDPPVRTTRRQAWAPTTVGGIPIGAGEMVSVSLAEGLAFGAGPRRCPGERHARALTGG